MGVDYLMMVKIGKSIEKQNGQGRDSNRILQIVSDKNKNNLILFAQHNINTSSSYCKYLYTHMLQMKF